MVIKEAINIGKEFYLSKRLESSSSTSRESFLAEHRSLFEKMRTDIESVLSDTEYFHGTGAKHYTNKINKYDSTDHTQVNDSLNSFLQNGIIPQQDIFNDVFDKIIFLNAVDFWSALCIVWLMFNSKKYAKIDSGGLRCTNSFLRSASI